MNEEGLVKVHIDLPNHWAVGGESLWAEPLGNDLYKIENVPFYAYGLNFQDVVRATPESENKILEIRELITASDHRTFRVFFKKQIDKAQQEAILDSMINLGISYERANHIYVALNMKPEGGYQAVFDQLDEYSEKEILGFETCEARIEGSFDDLPEGE
jgi:hypothetical protein